MIQKLFGFNPATMTLRKEVIGGITTFLTMAYILAVNPSILSATGMDAGAVFTTTCLSAVVGTLVMALYAKLPFALAPGMGLNAFFAYTVVLTMGYSWQFALTAVLIEGIIFILLTVTGLRKYIVNAIPLVLRRAISPGIGLWASLALCSRPLYWSRVSQARCSSASSSPLLWAYPSASPILEASSQLLPPSNPSSGSSSGITS